MIKVKVPAQHLPGGTEENHKKLSHNSWSPDCCGENTISQIYVVTTFYFWMF
jgi:hypothetical protein